MNAWNFRPSPRASACSRCSHSLRLLLAQVAQGRIDERPLSTVEAVPSGRRRGHASGQRLQRRDEQRVGEADVVRDEQRRVDDTADRPHRLLVLWAAQREQPRGERRRVVESVVGQQHLRVECPAKLARRPAARTTGRGVRHEPAHQVAVSGPGGVEREGQHGRDVRDEVFTAGGNQELRLTVGALGFQPVPDLNTNGRERRHAGGVAQAGDRQLYGRAVNSVAVGVDGGAVQSLMQRNVRPEVHPGGDLQHRASL